jgi:hypothetical protein
VRLTLGIDLPADSQSGERSFVCATTRKALLR